MKRLVKPPEQSRHAGSPAIQRMAAKMTREEQALPGPDWQWYQMTRMAANGKESILVTCRFDRPA
jgi:hypothetical protein